jgi:hypothetical protein
VRSPSGASILLTAGLLGLAAIPTWWVIKSNREVVRCLGGADAGKIVQSPARVELVRTLGFVEMSTNAGRFRDTRDFFETVGPARQLTKVEGSRISAILLKPSNYFRDSRFAKDSVFLPDLLLRFVGKDSTVEIFVSLEAGSLQTRSTNRWDNVCDVEHAQKDLQAVLMPCLKSFTPDE